MRKKSPPSTTRAARFGLPWEDRLCRWTLVPCGAVRPDRRPSFGHDLARPGQLCRLCGLCETGVMSLFLTGIKKDRLIAYREFGLPNKECARRLARHRLGYFRTHDCLGGSDPTPLPSREPMVVSSPVRRRSKSLYEIFPKHT